LVHEGPEHTGFCAEETSAMCLVWCVQVWLASGFSVLKIRKPNLPEVKQRHRVFSWVRVAGMSRT